MRTPAALILFAIAVSGCGSGDDAKPAPAAAKSGPYGSYTRTVTKADIARTQDVRDESGPGQEKPKSGLSRLTIAKGSGQDVLKVSDANADFTVAMDAGIDGGQLKLFSYVNPEESTFCGPQVAEAASYSYRMQGDALVLKPAHPDSCADRDTTLTGTWKRG
jgi:hypothetical protein